ncbi:acyl-CoA carboxylase subunit epsilon [Amycolatopsis sp. CA-128772]|uniref:acyl-CoA carboxylase subunit epsilon n=1 Tax=Amycolatopsis sp. CA-128772 TaxID=2073159 RepID=UPI000CD02B24|nr:acyl-CoA carboxylase subunit epsilon [Amycolatopsis sp. CA-128772]
MTKELVLVVRGEADDASLAALVTVLAGLAAAAQESPPPTRSAWAGGGWGNGPEAWRRSALPR